MEKQTERQKEIGFPPQMATTVLIQAKAKHVEGESGHNLPRGWQEAGQQNHHLLPS